MKSIHFIGIGGIGMSGLASMYKSLGYDVSGSDRGANQAENQVILAPLRTKDIAIYPQDGSYSKNRKVDFVVYSSAIEEDNPDFLAMSIDCQKLHRSVALQKIIMESNFKSTIAISGSCGKSSVCGLLSETLLNLGENVNALNGAIIKAFSCANEAGNFRKGDDNFFIFEADESDKSLVNYTPDYAILLNIGTDHYSKEELAKIFAEFINHVKNLAVVSQEVFALIKPYLTTNIPIISFSEKLITIATPEWAVQKYEIIENNNRRYPQVTLSDDTKIDLATVGFHHGINNLAIYILLVELGFDKSNIAKSLANFHGVFRRFDYAQTTATGVAVYDDYAHNPEKIISCLKGAREITNGNIFLVFQPHGYGPLKFMAEPLFEQLEANLNSSREKFIMLESFYAGGTSSFSPHSIDVIASYKAKSTKPECYIYSDNRTELTHLLSQNSKKGDLILIMGARDNSLAVFAKELKFD